MFLLMLRMSLWVCGMVWPAETASTCLVSDLERDHECPPVVEPEKSASTPIETPEGTSSRRRRGHRVKEARRARHERRSHPRPPGRPPGHGHGRSGRSRHSRCGSGETLGAFKRGPFSWTVFSVLAFFSHYYRKSLILSTDGHCGIIRTGPPSKIVPASVLIFVKHTGYL